MNNLPDLNRLMYLCKLCALFVVIETLRVMKKMKIFLYCLI